MENGVGGRASWSSTPYNLNLRQPNLNPNNGAKNDLQPSSQLSIDAPEFVPRFKNSYSNVAAGQQPQQQPQIHGMAVPPNTVLPGGLVDPAIIGVSFPQPMVAGRLNYPGPHQHQQHNMHSQQHTSQHHPMHSNIHEQNTMAAVVKNDHHHHGRFSVQNRLHLGGGGSNGGGGPPPNMMNGGSAPVAPDMTYGHNDSSSSQNNDKGNRVLNFLSELMQKLTNNPGMYEDVQHQISNMFYDYVGNNFVVSNAVEMVFELSVDEQNFRYIGARLCRLLDSIDSRTSLFRDMLCMKIDDHQTKLGGFMANNEQRKVRGTTLFLSELLLQMQNDGRRIQKVAESIVLSMVILLEKTGPENVKCVCQALKLCGYELELDCTRQIQKIITTLEDLENSLDVSTGRLLRSVLDLKAKHWGRSEPVMMAPIMDAVHQDYNDAPVFYGPDGQVLTDEENTFLLSNIPSYPNINFEDMEDNDADDLVEAEPEMDLEIQLAFKDFVKNSKNKQ